MRFDLDSAKLLYAVGVLFGVAALIYFARDLVFDLSMTVKSLLLALAFVALFVGGNATNRTGLDTVLYALSAASYLVFLAYTLDRFEVGETGTFLALAASSALFVALGYLLREREFDVDGRTARQLLVVVVVLAAVLVGTDLVAGGVVYTISSADEATVEEGNGVVLGTATAENQFVFRDAVEFPSAYACVYAPDRRVRPVDYRDADGDWREPGSVGARDTVRVTMWTWLDEEERAVLGEESIPVERAEECPAETDEPRIVVVVGEEPS